MEHDAIGLVLHYIDDEKTEDIRLSFAAIRVSGVFLGFFFLSTGGWLSEVIWKCCLSRDYKYLSLVSLSHSALF